MFAEAVLLRDVHTKTRGGTGWVEGTVVWTKSRDGEARGTLRDLISAPWSGWEEFRYGMEPGARAWFLCGGREVTTVRWLLLSSFPEQKLSLAIG